MVELFVNPDAVKSTGSPSTEKEEKTQRRRWVRLEVCGPVVLRQLTVNRQEQTVRRGYKEKSGMILNISGGGVLLSTFDSLTEGEFLLMKFEIKDFDTVSDVLGWIKRVEKCSDGENLVGIEFKTPANIEEQWLAGQLGQLVDDPLGFSERLHHLVSRFVFQRQVADAPVE